MYYGYLKNASITTAAPHWLHETIWNHNYVYTCNSLCVVCHGTCPPFSDPVFCNGVWLCVIMWTLNIHTRIEWWECLDIMLICIVVYFQWLKLVMVTEGAWYSLFNNFMNAVEPQLFQRAQDGKAWVAHSCSLIIVYTCTLASLGMTYVRLWYYKVWVWLGIYMGTLELKPHTKVWLW